MTRKLLPLGLLLMIVSACNNGSPTEPLVGFHRAMLTGVVKGESGRPIANSVTVDIGTPDAFHHLGESRTDDQGRYEIHDLPAGHWLLFVNTHFEVLARAEIDIHEGANTYDVVVPRF